MYNGIINIYKEKGYTSFDVVAKLRGIFHQKKIGHTGTLDPDAEGVLPVCLGNATKVCDLLMDQDKEYETVLLLGVETDTQDITGTVLSETPVTVDEASVRAAISSFVGSYAQIPPMYSARKVDGKKLYELARAGITVERKAKEVQIYEISILAVELPRVRMRIRCSKGTYIRTLCHDIGHRLGCGGCMEELLRTRVGEFRLEDALRISQIEKMMKCGHVSLDETGEEIQEKPKNVNRMLQKVDSLFEQYPAVRADVNLEKIAVNGNKIPFNLVNLAGPSQLADGERVRLYLEQSGRPEQSEESMHGCESEQSRRDRFIGIYSYQTDTQVLKPVKLFLN